MRQLIMKLFAPVLLLTLFLNPVKADIDLERSNLAKLVQEIDYLITRIDLIKNEASSDQRITFHYDTLKVDLHKIRNGINDHINQSLNAGRIIKPLSGQYHNYP